MTEPHSRLVYSTDGGRVRPPAPAPKPQGDGGAPRAPSSAGGYVRLQRERKGRGGKTVTLITGLDGSPDTLDALLRELKQVCGAGGIRNASTIEIQGDHRDRIEARLTGQGHRVKRVGG